MLSSPRAQPLLFIASGSNGEALRVIELLRKRFPEHHHCLVVTNELFDALPTNLQHAVVFVAGGSGQRLRFLKQLRHTSYALVVLLATGRPGYRTMKLAGLLAGLGRPTICYNENNDSFALDRKHARVIRQHLLNRIRVCPTRTVARSLGEPLLKAAYYALEPVGLLTMAADLRLIRLHRRGRGPVVIDASPRC